MLSTLQDTYRGLGLLMILNRDRFLSAGMIALGLAAGAYVLTL